MSEVICEQCCAVLGFSEIEVRQCFSCGSDGALYDPIKHYPPHTDSLASYLRKKDTPNE